MFELPEFNKVFSVLGFKEVRLSSIDEFFKEIRVRTKNIPIQIFDATCIAGIRHLLFATIHALNSFERKQNISENLAVEILLYASGTRQINKAIEMIGVKHDTSEVCMAFVTNNKREIKTIKTTLSDIVPGKRDDQVLDFRESKRNRLIEIFEITNAELDVASKECLKQSLVSIILERVAMVTIKR